MTMPVKYKQFDGEQVSVEWFTLLSDMRRAGVVFNVREGHRTMARQWYFWRLYKSGRGAIAAFPSPFAPHIRTGRVDHAIDFSNSQSVINAAAKRGVTLTRTVRWPNGTVREEWHLEANAAQLKAFYKSHKLHEEPVIKRGSRGRAVRRAKKLMWAKGLRGYSRYGWFFNKRAETAIKGFQHRRGMKADGVIGPRTWNELRKKR